MQSKIRLLLTIYLLCTVVFSSIAGVQPIVSGDVVFEEKSGIVAVEAEHFTKQSASEVRHWYMYSKGVWPKAGADHDDPHCTGASNHSYMEIIPDTRVSHADKLIAGDNFSSKPGKIAVIHYKVHFNRKGRYYVWVRTFSTGSEDNGLHVGLDGEWPESGQRMQWCEGKKSWTWGNSQRTDNQHCGVPHLIYLDIKKKGVHDIAFSMREDGFEFDKFVLTSDIDYLPEGTGPVSTTYKGTLPAPFPVVEKDLGIRRTINDAIQANVSGIRNYPATSFSTVGSGFYVDKNWLAINPNKRKEGSTVVVFNPSYRALKAYDMVFLAVGENDGRSEYTVSINNKEVGTFQVPMSKKSFEEGVEFCKVWKNITINKGDVLKVSAKVGTDGKEFSRARWGGIVFVAAGDADKVLKAVHHNSTLSGKVAPKEVTDKNAPVITGELRKWHKVTLTFEGPKVSETDEFNPFMNYRFNVTFTHSKTGKKHLVPGYFAADGNAGNTSSGEGSKWRVHFAPDEEGEWIYCVNFRKGNFVAVSDREDTGSDGKFMNQAVGKITIKSTNKTGRDFRGKGMLQYVGERYLKFAETKEYFLKVGSDSPENMLAYEEFDGTFHNDGHKDNLVKTWEAHKKHWKEGDPTWKGGKGKAIVGAVNYLASKGLNAFSFMTNNIAGDDQNVFPYIDYDTFDRIDCSKMDQWEVLFSHADSLGMFLHFKTLEVENQGLLDNGGVGANSKLYYRELIARFGHHLALNWNLCEESGDWVKNNRTAPQFKWQRLSMAGYFADHDPYKHHIVIHNGASFDDLLGTFSLLTGPSVQTNRADFGNVHKSVLHWINASKKAGKQWAVACDEPGDAQHSLVPDTDNPEHKNARMNGLWGTFMAGGWGTEWYFGYKHAHSDLSCQDYASRDLFWNQGKIALDFFKDNKIPFWTMSNHDELVLNDNDYCFASPGKEYLFFVKEGTAMVDLSSADGKLTIMWFNPRKGGALQKGSSKSVKAGAKVSLGNPPNEKNQDWVVVVTK